MLNGPGGFASYDVNDAAKKRNIEPKLSKALVPGRPKKKRAKAKKR